MALDANQKLMMAVVQDFVAQGLGVSAATVITTIYTWRMGSGARRAQFPWTGPVDIGTLTNDWNNLVASGALEGITILP